MAQSHPPLVTGPRIIVALDYASAQQALQMAQRLDPKRCRVKVGKELFTRAGPDVVRALQDKGFDVFLDLKFHDIPNTIAGACRAAAELGVWMVNVHASGGGSMMRAARDALGDGANAPLLIAVTVLTSLDQTDLAQVGLITSPADQVVRLAALAEAAGLDGVVLPLIYNACARRWRRIFWPSLPESGRQAPRAVIRNALLRPRWRSPAVRTTWLSADRSLPRRMPWPRCTPSKHNSLRASVHCCAKPFIRAV